MSQQSVPYHKGKVSISQEDAAEAFRPFSDNQKLFSPPRTRAVYSERTDDHSISPLTYKSGHTMEQHPNQQHPSTQIEGQISEDEENLYTNYSYSFDVQSRDCSKRIYEMYEALLYLLSNPSEFESAIAFYKNKTSTSTLSEFHKEYDRATDVGNDDTPMPIPFIVFSDDAEVVLPQAHTASQLFGIERETGMELEAACGILGLCQLFLRWLALMPSGDHMNTINPPGLTVMRIAGGRYRVTAAHRVVWTWNNEFLNDPTSSSTQQTDELHFGDLVTMTIVDVFETDSEGKLLSYCPTFDNRNVKKTDPRVEKIRKGSSRVKSHINTLSNSRTAAKVNEAAFLLGRLGLKGFVTVKDTIQKTVDEERKKKASSEDAPTPIQSNIKSAGSFERAIGKVEADAMKDMTQTKISQDEGQQKGGGVDDPIK